MSVDIRKICNNDFVRSFVSNDLTLIRDIYMFNNTSLVFSYYYAVSNKERCPIIFTVMSKDNNIIIGYETLNFPSAREKAMFICEKLKSLFLKHEETRFKVRYNLCQIKIKRFL